MHLKIAVANACRSCMTASPHAVRFLGSPESLPVPTPKGTPVGAWAFQEGGCELLLRLPRCTAAATWDRRQYDEAHLRELFLYVELNVSYTALPEELEPGYACAAACTHACLPCIIYDDFGGDRYIQVMHVYH